MGPAAATDTSSPTGSADDATDACVGVNAASGRRGGVRPSRDAWTSRVARPETAAEAPEDNEDASEDGGSEDDVALLRFS